MDLKKEIENAASIVSSGGIILYPTDTIWGLGCDATNSSAIEKIYEIKQRPANKSLIILLPSLKEILKYIAIPPINIQEVYDEFTLPTTVILDNALNLPHNLVNEDGSIAIRIPNDEFCKRLLMKIKTPLVSTSANISNMPSPSFFSEISDEIKNKVDYIVDHKRKENDKKSASRIVKLDKDGKLTILRP